MFNKLVIGNLKMNPVSVVEFERYLDMLEKEIRGKEFQKTKIVVCPPVLFLQKLLDRNFANNIEVGIQNAYWERQGAYTGEISYDMAKSLGARFAIVGHSERRKFFGENENVINQKLKAALKVGMIPVLCIGESVEERKSGQTASVLRKQLRGTLAGVGLGKLEYIIIAYEPVWAVGTDKIPTSDEILEAKIIIKKILAELYSLKSVEKVRILYGGSVKSNCLVDVCLDPVMDGVLIGRESLIPYEFIKIANLIEKN